MLGVHNWQLLVRVAGQIMVGRLFKGETAGTAATDEAPQELRFPELSLMTFTFYWTLPNCFLKEKALVICLVFLSKGRC